MGARRPEATLSGPGVDRGYDSAAVALSAAVSRASRAASQKTEATFYVRDRDGATYGFTESHADGTATVHRTTTKGGK